MPPQVRQRCCFCSAIFVRSRVCSRVPAPSSVHPFLSCFCKYFPTTVLLCSSCHARVCGVRVSRAECFQTFVLVGSFRFCAGEAFSAVSATKTCINILTNVVQCLVESFRKSMKTIQSIVSFPHYFLMCFVPQKAGTCQYVTQIFHSVVIFHHMRMIQC